MAKAKLLPAYTTAIDHEAMMLFRFILLANLHTIPIRHFKIK